MSGSRLLCPGLYNYSTCGVERLEETGEGEEGKEEGHVLQVVLVGALIAVEVLLVLAVHLGVEHVELLPRSCDLQIQSVFSLLRLPVLP